MQQTRELTAGEKKQLKILYANPKIAVPWYIWEDIRDLERDGFVTVNTRGKTWWATITLAGRQLKEKLDE